MWVDVMRVINKIFSTIKKKYSKFIDSSQFLLFIHFFDAILRYVQHPLAWELNETIAQSHKYSTHLLNENQIRDFQSEISFYLTDIL